MKNYIYIIFALMMSCKEEKLKDYLKPDNFPFSVIGINNKIKNTEEIRNLKNSFEMITSMDEKDEKKVKTTNIVSVSQIGKEKPYSFARFRCFSTTENNDVKVYVSYNTGLGGGGIKILKRNKTFSIRPLSWDDIGGSENDNIYKINYQKLTLDKLNYKIGDSIFGKVDVEIVKYFPPVDEIFQGEKFHEDEKFLKQNYSGYFQTKVEEKIYQ